MLPSKKSTIQIEKTKAVNLEDSNEEPEDDRNERVKNIVDCKSDSTSQICVDDEKSNEVFDEDKRTENESNFEINARNEVMLGKVVLFENFSKILVFFFFC